MSKIDGQALLAVPSRIGFLITARKSAAADAAIRRSACSTSMRSSYSRSTRLGATPFLIAAALVTMTPAMDPAAQAPVNNAFASLSFTDAFLTDADLIPNVPVVWHQKWQIDLFNLPDPGAPTIVNPSFELRSAQPLSGFFPVNVLVTPPIYRWDFMDLLVPGFPPRHLPETLFLTAVAQPVNNQVTATPRVTYSRAVTPELLVASETFQSVTATLIINEPLEIGEASPVLNTIFVSIGNVPVARGV